MSADAADGQDNVILVTDYGRSGQGWLSYMLCYSLNAAFIEPYDLLRGRRYSSSEMILKFTKGNLPGRSKTRYDLVVKTHERPAPELTLTRKVILLTRDPRDVAVSAYFRYRNLRKKESARSPKEFIANVLYGIRFTSYLVTAYRWRRFYRAWAHVECRKVTYENMSSDPRSVLRDLFEYLEVDVPENVLVDAISTFSFEGITGRRKGQEVSSDSEFRKGIVGDYRNHFGRLHLVAFHAICGRQMRQMGYQP